MSAPIYWDTYQRQTQTNRLFFLPTNTLFFPEHFAETNIYLSHVSSAALDVTNINRTAPLVFISRRNVYTRYTSLWKTWLCHTEGVTCVDTHTDMNLPAGHDIISAAWGRGGPHGSMVPDELLLSRPLWQSSSSPGAPPPPPLLRPHGEIGMSPVRRDNVEGGGWLGEVLCLRNPPKKVV